MTRWFTADCHYIHPNIIKYTHRPQLKTGDLNEDGSWVSNEVAHLRAEQMNEMLMRESNQRVKPEDSVICVGDFACRGGEKGVMGSKAKPGEILKKLNGHWTIVSGNHDVQNGVKPLCEFMSCEMGNYHVGVQHIPLYDSKFPPQKYLSERRKKFLEDHSRYCADYFDFMICGHVHDAWKVKKVAGIWHVNVGVDVCRYMPINDVEVMLLYEKALKGAV